MKIGNMLWKIGDILPFYEQVDWIRGHGFEEISFHSWSAPEGHFAGFSPFDKSEAEIERLRAALAPFEARDVHAPFGPADIYLAARSPRTLDGCLRELEGSIALAERIGAETVTVHADVTPRVNGKPDTRPMILDSLRRLGERAAKGGVRIAAELTGDYEIVRETGLANVGLTIDVGHLSFENGAGYRDYGSIGGVIKAFSERIFLLHMHDYDGKHDHLEVGKGRIDFEDIISALLAIGYQGSLCLEINPDAGTPDSITRSRDRLKAQIARLLRSA